jgi:meso-butanediol dehydrogenase / (S,S)-butanediol dehydrogenase / diacetyl reductase
MQHDYEGKAAVVTGAASGLGRATALALVRAGARVLAVDVTADGLAETLADAGSENIRSFAADLSQLEDCASVVEQAVSAFGRLDLLCNVAGIARMDHVADVTVDQFRRMIDINLSAPFFLSQAALPHLIETNGAIVNVASSAGIQGQAYMVPYSASKAGLIGLTKAMAMEFIHAPVRINAIAPAGMNTPMTAPGYMMPPEGFSLDLLGRYSGIREKAEPEKMADFILYVGSGRGAFFHGACLSMDQGQTAG